MMAILAGASFVNQLINFREDIIGMVVVCTTVI